MASTIGGLGAIGVQLPGSHIRQGVFLRLAGGVHWFPRITVS